MIQAHHIPIELRLSAAERLVASPGEKAAAKRLVANAESHNIDLNLLWGAIGTLPNNDRFVRQVCLGVIGAGKTAMLFLSAPKTSNPFLGNLEVQKLEIAASIHTALDGLENLPDDEVKLVQTLLEPQHRWAIEVCTDAGMTFVGRLEYLRRPLTPNPASDTPTVWPDSIRVRPVDDVLDFTPDGDGTNLAIALDASYEDTLDCPELCGVRSTRDVIESHQSAGVFDPNHWYLVEHNRAPVGCCLLSKNPDQGAVELVYIGLGPSVRGLGLGRTLLDHAINNLHDPSLREITCAVDTRNEPALKVYESMGFESFDARIGYIANLNANASRDS